MRKLGLGAINLLLPDSREILSQWHDWANLVATVPRRDSDPTPTHESYSRMWGKPITLKMFSDFTWDRGMAWSAWWPTMLHTTRRYIFNLLSHVGVFTMHATSTDEKLILSELGDLAKKYQTALFGEYWMDLVDLHLLCDYVPAAAATFTETIRSWVNDIPKHELGDQATFSLYFRKGLEEVFAHAEGYEPEPITVNKWLSDPSYFAKSGTSDGVRLEMTSEAGITRARKSKWATFLAMSHRDLKSLLFSRSAQKNRAIGKRERGKLRGIISGDNSLYLKHAYISRWLEPMLAGHPNMPLFYNAEKMLSMYYEMMRIKTGVNIPTDEKAYDAHITLDMILDTIAEIRLFVTTKCTWPNVDELLELLDLIKYAHENGTVTVIDEQGKHVFRYRNGVMSGWRWTALLNTIMNAAKVYAFSHWALDWGKTKLLNKFVSFGDDVRANAPDYESAITFFSLYDTTGFEVNAKKTFISPLTPDSTYADEFLRQVATNGTLRGYPARAASTLIFRNPVSSNPAPGEVRITELIHNWNLVLSRNRNTTDSSWHHALLDVSRANKLPYDTLARIVHTPAYLGGVGATPYTTAPLVLKTIPATTSWYYKTIPPLASNFSDPLRASAIWKANIQAGPKVPHLFSTFSFYEPPVMYRPWLRPPSYFSPPDYTHPHWRDDILPTEVEIILQDVRSATIERLRYYYAPLLHDRIRYTFLSWLSFVSRRVLVSWLAGNLPIRVPIVRGAGGLQISVIYTRWWRSLWWWRLSFSKLTWSQVMRIAATAENELHNELSLSPLMTG